MKTPEGPSSPVERHEVIGRRIGAGALPSHDFFYSVTEAVPAGDLARHGDRRGEKRLKTRLRDGVVAERRVLVDCRIRDKSRTGARLQLEAERPLPRVFVLTDPASRARYSATLIWQVGREAGVRLRALDER
jgi:hypothetical protein